MYEANYNYLFYNTPIVLNFERKQNMARGISTAQFAALVLLLGKLIVWQLT